MRTATLILAALATLLVACSKKEEPAKPPGPDKIVAPAKTPPVKLECDALVPKDVRDKYFAGATFEPMPTVTTRAGKTMNCMFKKGDELQMVQVICNKVPDDTVNQAMDQEKAAMKDAKDLPGIGKRAFAGTQNGKHILRFTDDDTSCTGSIMGSVSEDVAKYLVAHLTPDMPL